jgi:carbon-monoxide dehydrogenase medium subunit
MIPAAFEYLRPASVDEAVKLLDRHGDDAKILAGGHSLLPAMKLRLAQPRIVIDIGRLGDLKGVREKDGRIAVGALTTHWEIQSSALLREKCPLLPEVAGHIGDVQVRNRGTIGGSLAHADPAGDWPAAALALDAEIDVLGPQGSRTIRAKDFFLDVLQAAVRPNEILREIRVAPTGTGVAYQKFAQKASGFAVCGVAALVDRVRNTASIGITGVGGKAYRPSGAEAALRGNLTAAGIVAASKQAAAGVECLSDIHASAEYRAHLAGVLTRRALERALARA